ncbi:MAG: hypothetical protein HKN08_13130 [Gammaproteobacteria bacterium]|nr:hypothetical protein [Gammaproteobacteria bacterium]
MPIVCLAMVLQSMVATGFMLTVDHDAPLGFSVTLCESMDTGEGLLTAHTHEQGESGNEVGPHQHSSDSSIIDSDCCDWCGTSKFLFVTNIEHDQFIKDKGSPSRNYDPVFSPRKPFLTSVKVRAPPVPLFIS